MGLTVFGFLTRRFRRTRPAPAAPASVPEAPMPWPDEPPAFPWALIGTCPVGGLRSVGFADGSDLLLIVSEQGRIVVDGLTSVQVARDPMRYFVGQEQGQALGIGPLKGQIVRVAGLFGGVLPAVTADGWSGMVEGPGQPEASVLLVEPPRDLFDLRGTAEQAWRVAPAEGVIVAGFSDTGRSFVFATQTEAVIYGRAG